MDGGWCDTQVVVWGNLRTPAEVAEKCWWVGWLVCRNTLKSEMRNGVVVGLGMGRQVGGLVGWLLCYAAGALLGSYGLLLAGNLIASRCGHKQGLFLNIGNLEIRSSLWDFRCRQQGDER